MVLIAPPPPDRFPSPSFYVLPQGSQIFRIFNPAKYQTQALTFRFYGPIHRFDHQRSKTPEIDLNTGIYYAANNLSGCLVEYFGDTGIIEITTELVCCVDITRDLKLLDLRGSGAMKAGSVAALSKTADRILSQLWSRYFYEQTDIYSTVDGLLYFNAHNDEKALALYERAQHGLACSQSQIINLSDYSLRSEIQEIAFTNNMIFIP